MPEIPDRAGPILYLRHHAEGAQDLAALVILPETEAPPPLRVGEAEVTSTRIATHGNHVFWRYDFRLTPDQPGYEWDGRVFEVRTDNRGDITLAFVSCNGEENDDLARDPDERNAMWAALAAVHEATPLSVLLQGGDQIYADEVTHGHPLSEGWPKTVPPDPDAAALEDLADHFRQRFLERYLLLLATREPAWIMARVPSLAIWDDHDICDGWGSLPEDVTRSAVGQTLFRVARQFYLLFQHAATEADIPALFLDPNGQSLGWRRELPELRLLAPDLRSERGRHQVMGEAGWRGVAAEGPTPGHTFLLSSVPLLGPRLSLLEGFLMVLPKIQQYEDDLRDQWQSRAHREEWKRMLRETLRLADNGPVTVLSGEIHLATRAEMDKGAKTIHQLVASGIAHRAPPRAYAGALGWLALFGAAPLPGHPIRIRPLPGQGARYIAERNFLVLHRHDQRWSAVWHLEESGPTPPLPLSP